MSKNPKVKSYLFKTALTKYHFLWSFVFVFLVGAIFFVINFTLPPLLAARYEGASVAEGTATSTPVRSATSTPVFVATHVATPSAVKGIYMTSWVAGSKDLRNKLVQIVDTSEINSIVIDIKDYTGRISFAVNDPYLQKIGAQQERILDIREFIKMLHEKNIYVIGRVSAFQDAHLVKVFPEFAVRTESDNTVWKDYKGISWLDAGSKDVWKYLVAIGKEAYADGFDELNFDYIRFPSDGNMKDISYPYSKTMPKPEILRQFFAYLNKELKPSGVVLSADLFGMTSTNKDDLGIGQVLENALPYFDYISPMVYPSHYPPNFLGFTNPAAKPYEVVKFSMDSAVRRSIASSTTIALFGEQPISTTSRPYQYKKEIFSAQKIRPWLQDFNLGAVYTADMVRLQIQATYDSGLTSWMLWNASNKYTKDALLKEGATSSSTNQKVN